jgi:hypothetical protein
MRRLVVTDQRGRILATSLHPEDKEAGREKDAPRHLGFIPLPGQKVHVIEFPESLSALESLRRLHETHRVGVVDGKPQLTLSHRSKGKARRKGGR